MSGDPAFMQDWRRRSAGAPDDAAIWADAARLAMSIRQADLADRYARRALALRSADLMAHLTLVMALTESAGKVDELERLLRRAATIADPPSSVSSWLADRAAALGDFGEAGRRYAQALAAFPLEGEIWRRSGAVRRAAGALYASRRDARRSIALAPGDPEGLNELAKAHHSIGALPEATTSFKRALSAAPDSARIRSRYLVCLAYANVREEERFAAHREWGRRHGGRTELVRKTPTSSEGKLRVGYLSADLRNHSIARNLIPIIENHERATVEATAYSASTTEDSVSHLLQGMVHRWRRVDRMSDKAIADLVASDDIDVLVILAGHMEGNCIGVARHRPAAVQVAAFDVGTSGLEEVDYWLTDELLHPTDAPAGSEQASERLWRVPSCLVHLKPEEAGEPGPCPSERTGGITFGSFSNPAKITPETIALWAETLRAVPRSRLLLRFFGRTNDRAVTERLTSEFARRGVASERIEFAGEAAVRRRHLDLYAEVDIALDTFPFNGSTTVFEALWMGVPVVSQVGRRFVSRMGYNHLARLNLADLAVSEPTEFATAAARLAIDGGRRAMLRGRLRAALSSSVLCDGVAGARAFETAFREMRRRVGQPSARAKPL